METVATVNWIAEADALCVLLESNGITATIPDQGTVTLDPILANAIGGIRIQVSESDSERAREILMNRPPHSAQGVFMCPRCGSDSVRYENVSKRFAFLMLISLGIPLLWRKRQCSCQSCGHRWKDR